MYNRLFLSKSSSVSARLLILMSFLFFSCSVNEKPQAVSLNKDICTECSMVIMDSKFAAEIITDKGRCLMFDDITCLFHHITKMENTERTVRKMYVADYLHSHTFLDVTTAFLVLSDSIKSPMGGGVAAFSDYNTAAEYAKTMNGILLDSWERLRIQH